MPRLLPILLALTTAAAAQQPWQQLTHPTAAAIKSTFAAPPSVYGPEPYYGLNGPVTLAVVQRDLDTMHRLGYGAVTVQAGYGTPFEYLSPEYFAFFKQFVAEAKKRDMHVWIVDDAGYPSGFAGGKFTSEHPELRMQALVVSQRLTTSDGKPVTLPLNANVVAISAVDGSGKTMSVPLATTWTPTSNGPWTISVVEHRFSTSPTRSDTNPQRVKDGSQSLEDYLDPAATAQYLAFTHEAYKQAVGDEFGATILGFRGDEPDYSIAGLPWTPKFLGAFERIKGYDIRPFLAAFTPAVRTPGAPPTQAAALSERDRRARADYYDVFSQLFRDGFFKPQADWCAHNHLEYQVHLNHEEMELQLVRSEGEFFRDMRFVQVPGIDSIWHQIWTDTISDFPRLASSAAHLYGHPRAFTESFAAYRPEPDLTMARYVLNEQFVRGINLVETMYFPATSTPTRGPSKYMADPGYPALLTYVRRMSYLMSQGRPDASVALLLPSSSLWLNDTQADTQFVSAERLLSEHQIDFDVIDEDFLATPSLTHIGCPRCMFYAPERKGKLQTASGNLYSTVIVPSAVILSQGSMTNLQSFAKAGGKVLFLGSTPTMIAGKTILDARAATPADFVWATVVPDTLPETPTPPAQPPATPPTPMQVPPAVLKALTAVTPAQPVMLDTPNTALRLTTRRLVDAEVILLFNESATAIQQTLVFTKRPAAIETWDPQTGVITASAATARMPLDLGPYESRVLVVR